MNIEFATFSKIEFDGIKLGKAGSEKSKTSKCKVFSFPLGPTLGSYQGGVTLTRYPHMLISSLIFIISYFKSQVFFHFRRAKVISYI